MRINFVTEPESIRWVLRPLAESLASHIPHATVSTEAVTMADWNIFVNYALYRSVSTKTAGVFTHREFGDRLRDVFDDVAREVDWCFAQCEITAALLPVDKTTILPTAPDPMFYKDPPLVLGVVGRERKSGRKRMDWVDDLRQIQGVEVRVTNGKIPWEEMPAFYDGIDYLVVLADNEGGPQPVLEALAKGKPVIAPNVGYCWEYPVVRYTTKDDLLSLVWKLVLPREGWKLSARVVLDVLGRL